MRELTTCIRRDRLVPLLCSSFSVILMRWLSIANFITGTNAVSKMFARFRKRRLQSQSKDHGACCANGGCWVILHNRASCRDPKRYKSSCEPCDIVSTGSSFTSGYQVPYMNSSGATSMNSTSQVALSVPPAISSESNLPAPEAILPQSSIRANSSGATSQHQPDSLQVVSSSSPADQSVLKCPFVTAPSHQTPISP
jgi:hypothetical protein